MGESIGIGIAAGMFALALIGAIATAFFRMGGMEARLSQTEEDIKKIRETYVKGVDEVSRKLDSMMQKVDDACSRLSRLEGSLGPRQ